MKFNLINRLSFFLVIVVSFSLFYSATSCSDNIGEDGNNGVDKTNSMEFRNSLFFPQADGSILKYENNQKVYAVGLNTEINASKNINSRTNTSTYRITNPNTGEFIDIVDIVEENNYCKFNAITSNGERVNDIKYYGDNFISSLDIYTNNNTQRIVCPPCIPIIVAAVVTIVDSLQDSPLEQCRSAMRALNCTGGSNAYMEFNEGWFSTTCNVGCR